MSKTPEEMAEEYADDWHKDCDYPEPLLVTARKATKTIFLAGYQAAKDEEVTKDQKIAALWTESIKNMLSSVHEVVLFPSESTRARDAEVVAKMDAAIKKAKDQQADADKVMPQWISVKDRLPPPETEVLWWNKTAHQAGVSSWEYMSHCEDTMIYWGDAGNVSIKNFTQWMPLPKTPKDAKE